MLESFVVTNSLLFMLSSHDCIYINFREIIISSAEERTNVSLGYGCRRMRQMPNLSA